MEDARTAGLERLGAATATCGIGFTSMLILTIDSSRLSAWRKPGTRYFRSLNFRGRQAPVVCIGCLVSAIARVAACSMKNPRGQGSAVKRCGPCRSPSCRHSCTPHQGQVASAAVCSAGPAARDGRNINPGLATDEGCPSVPDRGVSWKLGRVVARPPGRRLWGSLEESLREQVDLGVAGVLHEFFGVLHFHPVNEVVCG